MSRQVFPALAVIALALAFSTAPAYATGSTPSAKCSTPVHHQFDFWIGDWDTFDHDAPDKPSVARNHVDAILDGCVLREDYNQFDGLHGQSFTIYDATRKLWHQSWVTNRGELLVLEGSMQDRRIVLNGIDHGDSDAMIQVGWEPQGDGVREIALKSHDRGKHWQPLFDIVFRPHARGS
jgi:hypothetical protein